MARQFTGSGVALALLIALGGAAARAEEPLPNPPPSKPAPTSEPSWFTPPEGGTCRQWSDGCHVCIQGSAEAVPTCSTSSIACVQTVPRCLEPQPSPQ